MNSAQGGAAFLALHVDHAAFHTDTKTTPPRATAPTLCPPVSPRVTLPHLQVTLSDGWR